MELMKEDLKAYPHLYESLLSDRNEYMTYQLRQCAAHSQTTVAILGAAHVGGIAETCWHQTDIDVEELRKPDPAPPLSASPFTMYSWTGCAVGVAAVGVVAFVAVRVWRQRQ